MRHIRRAVALAVCVAALLLPYRARVAYAGALAFLAHLPYRLFGAIARSLLRRLGLPAPDRAS